MARGQNYAEELFTPSQEKAYIASRITSIKLSLTSSYDVQAVLDSVDMNSLAKDMNVETSQFYGIIQDKMPIEGNQAENFYRGAANILSEDFNSEGEKTKRYLVKRVRQAKKIADEKEIPVETVFNDQTLYFQLIRESISPEEVIDTNKQLFYRN